MSALVKITDCGLGFDIEDAESINPVGIYLK